MSHDVHVTSKFAVTKFHKLKVVMHVYSAKPFQDVTTLQQQNKRAWHVTSKQIRLSGGGVIKSSVRILSGFLDVKKWLVQQITVSYTYIRRIMTWHPPRVG